MSKLLSMAEVQCRRWFRRCVAASQIRRICQHKALASGPLLFAVVRNEMLRLPRFLTHYRERGVSSFVFLANNCTDETEQWLEGQPDVTLYVTSGNFLQKEAWLDLLLRRHGMGRWCLVADADELLEYPESNHLSIGDLCHYLQSRGESALHAILLDLYPDTPLAGVGYQSGENFFNRTWFFDPLDTLHVAPRVFAGGLDHRLEGGSRMRIFGVKSCCSKFPLFRFEPGVFLTDGQHYIEGAQVSTLRAVLYHLKYLQDFIPHVQEEVVREQHWQGAAEYKVYASRLKTLENSSFRDERSIRLEGTHQLEDLGFLIRPKDFSKCLVEKA